MTRFWFRDGKIRKMGRKSLYLYSNQCKNHSIVSFRTPFRRPGGPTEGIAAKRRKGIPPLVPWGCRGIEGAFAPQSKSLPAREAFALGSLVQGGLEPPDALDRQDLGVASVLSRTDGQGADLAGCGIAEMTILSLARYTLQPSARRVESVYRWMSFCGYCF